MTNPPASRHYQHYEVLQRPDGNPWELGRGAMGITYKAYDVNLCCEVALKVVNSALLDNPDARERFVREARAAAALRHRHVASVYHLGNDGEHFFYAMEFIDGENLDALVRRLGPLPVGVVLKIVLQVAKALVAADRQRLVHRDIKPANLMVVHEDADDELTVKVIDFGLARPMAGAESLAPVTLGGFVGTPQYASPEQLEERPLDARSDIYSLGITAWYLLTGRPPFSGSLAVVCQQQLSKPPPWSLLPGNLPENVRRLLGHMLEKNPADRPQTARALRTEVEACLRELPPEAADLNGLTVLPSATASEVPSTTVEDSAGTLPMPRAVAGGRYVVTAYLGEEPGVKLYRARDTEQTEGPVTVRQLSAGWLAEHARGRNLAEEVRHIQAASHPRLVKIQAAELGSGGAGGFLIEEPLVSFTLRDLLAARGGSLPPGMMLALTDQAAAALDHAERCRLTPLELTLARARIHFPFADPAAPDDGAAREMLTLPFHDWPAWSLKLHPLATEQDNPDHGTWAGSVTLVQPLRHLPTVADSAGPVSGNVWKLANLVYELLGGSPGSAASRQRRASLSSLSEAGNAILHTALFDPTAYPDCRAFHAALAEEMHEGREPLSMPVGTRPAPVASPVPFTRSAVDTTHLQTRNPAKASGAERSAGTTVVDSPWQEETPQAQGAFEEVENTAWERMALARSHEARPGRWLLGGAVGAAVFVGAFAAVFIVLMNRSVSRPTHAAADQVGAASKSIATRANARDASHKAPSAPTAASAPTPIPQVRLAEALPSTVPPASPATTPSPAPSATKPENRLDLTMAQGAEPSPTPSASEETATVHLTSEPTGAAIWWHDKLLGITPVDVTVPVGTQTFIARKRGSLDTVQFFHVEPGQDAQTATIRLMPPNLDPTWRDKSSVISKERGQQSRVVSPASEAPSPQKRIRAALPVNATPPSTVDTAAHPYPLQPFEQVPSQ